MTPDDLHRATHVRVEPPPILPTARRSLWRWAVLILLAAAMCAAAEVLFLWTTGRFG